MAELSGNIRPQNIVDRYADFVTATANENLTWNRENLPFPEFNSNLFESGNRSITVTGSDIDVAGNNITPNNIYNALLNETATYTNLRNLRALLFVEGGGGNTGSRPTPGFVYDSTSKAHFTTEYRQSLDAVNQGIATGQDITVLNLEALFGRLRDAYTNKAVDTVTVQVNVCHASCHSSCHGSRGRR
jgi:hypothetical protein